jgi:hypothetical protein
MPPALTRTGSCPTGAQSAPQSAVSHWHGPGKRPHVPPTLESRGCSLFKLRCWSLTMTIRIAQRNLIGQTRNHAKQVLFRDPNQAGLRRADQVDAFAVASSGRTPIRTANALNSNRRSNRLRATSSTSDKETFSSTAVKRRPRTRMAFRDAIP